MKRPSTTLVSRRSFQHGPDVDLRHATVLHAYCAEEEWRLITHDVRGERVNRDRVVELPTGYRAVAGRTVRYQDLVCDHLTATGIVLGFSSAMAPDDPGLDELLTNTGMTLPITRSEVPVRP